MEQLDKKKALKPEDAEMILTIADCNINLAQVAQKLYVHRNTVSYRIERIRKQTGLDATKFYDLVKLVELVKAEN